jgi:hypothetical protein
MLGATWARQGTDRPMAHRVREAEGSRGIFGQRARNRLEIP